MFRITTYDNLEFSFPENLFHYESYTFERHSTPISKKRPR
ncbi:hypothetical protein PPBDW_I20611 [Photobacterium kishitanii]|nr:hypothetical protein PPBDW_I20611 [Photobacterium kishitanii]